MIEFIEIHMKSSICMLDTHELAYGWHILAYELAYCHSQIVVKIVFFDGIRSTREIPMRLKRQIKKPGETNFTRHLARHNGLEPVASRLGGVRSIQLS